jgi:hypothetical protein
MPENEQEFVVSDRRKFRMDGDTLEHVATAEPDKAPEPESTQTAASGAPEAANAALSPTPQDEDAAELEPEMPTPSAEDAAASQKAYQATAERMDDLMRATNPGAPHEGPINFDRVIQSLYVTAIVQLGLNTPAGQQMRVDLMGARHTIDMLGVLLEKTRGNLTPEEEKLMQSVLFELRMSFLEMTQAIAQSAQAAKAGGKAGVGAPGLPGIPGGPLPGGKIKL